ncbi:MULTISPECIES: histidinol-phosphate transaminase [Helicobacter]|uniref:histidinol-phosphate transaminase n=1 Tax=Helicobacter TaxID=209 RepID=UPI00051D4AB9|nr:histidinol-phosphate transaminase [Helicobacter sp. MIT 03-1616]TLD89746.1 histidinol-phosphate transaminase [Helicobacter sp. MIT 03-1616]
MFKKTLDSVVTYEAGKPIELVMREYGIKQEDVIKLGSNENPYGTSPKVIETLQKNAHKAFLYPDDSMYELKNALASRFCVNPKEIIIGAGSDQVIEFCLQAIDHTRAAVLMAKTTFAMYEVYSKLADVEIHKTRSDAHNLDEFLESYENVKNGASRTSITSHSNKECANRASIIFLCVPNNPLGECLDSQAIEDFICKVDKDTLIVLDGAYQEFASYKDKAKALNPASLIKKFDNVIYLGTFSKVYGLGGMRIGYGIASERIISMLYKVRPPFNVSTLSLQAALVALEDRAFTEQCIQSNIEQMLRYEEFAKHNNIDFIPSFGNFITFSREDIESTHLCQWLLQRGVIVRNLRSYGLNAFRITIGTPAQNARVFELLQEYLQTRG